MDDERSARDPGAGVRRIELTMRRPRFALYAGVRPTLVIGERGQPTQWGRGTWQIPTDRPVVIEVFLFNRLWRFGRAEASLTPEDDTNWEYRAPMLPFLRGRLRPA
ncbi:hypothetical protein E0W80_12675 [Microbacterium sp. PI-1]|uniref:Uncharacterized protein n=1 Tax=Microbacterium aurugineum TaxID=2851642 RepID=A0ABY4J2P8_9MICO|nr:MULTISPECIES: hypothetical protein [Microbacterium]QEA28432.1 hypothetical protein FGL91_07570 [Microbacterium sp. CBA3102]TCJ22792.1 hypothetical protein E0W80_12675 [Microbacterium sp. PI-1]UPL18820.1 hypothetical protein KV397_14170 [Microbacterium aurugineum]